MTKTYWFVSLSQINQNDYWQSEHLRGSSTEDMAVKVHFPHWNSIKVRFRRILVPF